MVVGSLFVAINERLVVTAVGKFPGNRKSRRGKSESLRSAQTDCTYWLLLTVFGL